jgi:hypothetical protein
MGVARLLAKGWVVFCLFAGAHALHLGWSRGESPIDTWSSVGLCVFLFGAMGLLFITGFGMSSSQPGVPLLQRFELHHLIPSFNGSVFLIFAVFIFVNQVFVAPHGIDGAVAQAASRAMYLIVPGHRALYRALGACALDGGRIFASAISWLLAIIYVGSAVSRVGLSAGLLRLEQTQNPSAFGPTLLAALYGVAAIIGFQLLFVGSVYSWLQCSVFTDIGGAIVIGLAPLMLAYLIVAALTTLRASGPAQ